MSKEKSKNIFGRLYENRGFILPWTIALVFLVIGIVTFFNAIGL